MASLQNQQIDQTYAGLIKTNDEAALGATEKVIQDGAGNNSTLSMGTASASFTGTLDLSGATVTGLPAGSAGLESGSGADSMQSAASLTTTGANASGASAIALGNAATSSSNSSIAIGQDAQATGSGNDGRIAIGKSASATKNKAVVLGVNGCSSASEGIAIGDGVDIAASSDRTIAIGNAINVAGGAADSIVMGTSADSNAPKGIALGFSANVTATEGIALGYQVTAGIANTLSTKALELQTDSTPTAGGIIMSDAGGTDRRLNIDASGNLQIDSTPVGGGGGGAAYSVTGQSGMAGYFMYNDSAQANHYKTWVQTTGYGRSTTGRQADEADWAVITLPDGGTISKIALNVFTASAASTAEVAIYDFAQTTDGGLILYNRLATLGTIDTSTTGDKVITLGTPFTMPSNKLNNQVAFVVFPSDSTVQMSGWTQGVWNGAGGQLVTGTLYRPMALHVKPGVSEGTALPSLIGAPNGSTIDYSAQTSNPLFFLYKN